MVLPRKKSFTTKQQLELREDQFRQDLRKLVEKWQVEKQQLYQCHAIARAISFDQTFDNMKHIVFQ
jgi:hypothetical protein